MSAATASNVFSICIPKARPLDWREVKQLWYVRFPDDEVEQVDVVPYGRDHPLAGFCKIFVHWRPESVPAIKMRDYLQRGARNEWLIDGPACGEDGIEKWACSQSRLPRKERKQKEASAVAETVVEYAEPYNEVPPPPPPQQSTPATTDDI